MDLILLAGAVYSVDRWLTKPAECVVEDAFSATIALTDNPGICKIHNRPGIGPCATKECQPIEIEKRIYPTCKER